MEEPCSRASQSMPPPKQDGWATRAMAGLNVCRRRQRGNLPVPHAKRSCPPPSTPPPMPEVSSNGATVDDVAEALLLVTSTDTSVLLRALTKLQWQGQHPTAGLVYRELSRRRYHTDLHEMPVILALGDALHGDPITLALLQGFMQRAAAHPGLHEHSCKTAEVLADLCGNLVDFHNGAAPSSAATDHSIAEVERLISDFQDRDIDEVVAGRRSY